MRIEIKAVGGAINDMCLRMLKYNFINKNKERIEDKAKTNIASQTNE